MSARAGESGTSADGRLLKEAAREILLSFWKIHILHHASEGPLVGQWMLEELRRHGYRVSPGTLYPVLKRMEARAWLSSTADPRGGRRARRDYVLTARGARVLAIARRYLAELGDEVQPRPAALRSGGQHPPQAVRSRRPGRR